MLADVNRFEIVQREKGDLTRFSRKFTRSVRICMRAGLVSRVKRLKMVDVEISEGI